MAGEEIQRDLSRCPLVSFADRRKQAPADAVRRRKIAVAERSIADDRDVAPGAIGQQPTLDAAVDEMIQYLVAGHRFIAQRAFGGN